MAGYNSIADIRQSWGQPWADASDEKVLEAYSRVSKIDITQLANDFGYDPGKGSLTNERVGGAADSYQSNLYGTLGAVGRAAGLPEGVTRWADSGRDDNKVQADIQAGRARQLGGIDDWRDVNGFRSGANFVGGLAAQSLPYMAELGVGAATGGATLAGTAARMGMTGALARTAPRIAGAAVAGYPSAVGDVLSSQRDENGGENVGSALAGGVAYDALNFTGIGGLVTKGSFGRSLIRGLDNVKGVRGAAARAGTTALGVGAQEGASETGQEMINQSFGRMAVNPDQTLFNPEANTRYVDSFVGGMALGGAFSAPGGMRRSEAYQRQQKDLLDQRQYESDGSNFQGPNQSPGPMNQPDYMDDRGPNPQAYGPQANFDYVPNDMVGPGQQAFGPQRAGPEWGTSILPEGGQTTQQGIDARLGIGAQRYAGTGYAGQFTAAANEPTGEMLSRQDGGQTEYQDTTLDARPVRPKPPMHSAAKRRRMRS
jgi:hypothetical protein